MSETGKISIDNCEFNENGIGDAGVFSSIGGAIFCFDADTLNISNSSFVGNQADAAGAIATQTTDSLFVLDAKSNITISNSEFRQNRANSTSAGAVRFALNADVNISDCTFDANFAEVSAGAMTYFSFFGSAAAPTNTGNGTVNIDRTIFSNNIANTGQGGALEVNDALLNVTNSLFSQNFVLSTEDGGGGAISLNSSLFDVEREFINNTFYNNFLAGDGVGYDIANFVGNDSISSTTTLTNNAFFNVNGTSYQLEAADAILDLR